MRLVLDDVFVQPLPKGKQGSPVEMPLGPAQLDHGDGPVSNVLLECSLLLFNMKPSNPGKNINRSALMRPPLKLPGLSHHEDRNHSVPLSIV